MKTRNPHDDLSRLLAEWRLAPTPTAAFRPLVWQRIQESGKLTWGGYVRAHVTGWSLATALCVVLASWAGHAAGEARLRAEREAMVVTYLVDLDPRVQASLQEKGQ